MVRVDDVFKSNNLDHERRDKHLQMKKEFDVLTMAGIQERDLCRKWSDQSDSTMLSETNAFMKDSDKSSNAPSLFLSTLGESELSLDTNHIQQQTEHMAMDDCFEPIRRVVNFTNPPPPPRRFFRTFWSSLARNLLYAESKRLNR